MSSPVLENKHEHLLLIHETDHSVAIVLHDLCAVVGKHPIAKFIVEAVPRNVVSTIMLIAVASKLLSEMLVHLSKDRHAARHDRDHVRRNRLLWSFDFD